MTTAASGAARTGIARGPAAAADLGEDETTFEQKEVAGLSQAQIVRTRFLRHKPAMISLVVLILVMLLAATSIGWGPIPRLVEVELLPPRWAARPGSDATLAILCIGGHDFFSMGDFPFGASGALGYDNFAQVMRGIQQTTWCWSSSWACISTAIGVVIGAVAGYYRGWVDSVIMRFTDLIITLPIVLVTAVLGVAVQRPRRAARWRWRSACCPGPNWLGWSALNSSPCGSGNSSMPPGWPAPPTPGSSSSTSCPTRSASSSSTRPW